MKKNLVLFLMTIMSLMTIINAQADDRRTCPVRGNNDIVATIVDGANFSNAEYVSGVTIDLTKPAPEGGIRVVVAAYDSEGNFLDSQVIEISEGETRGWNSNANDRLSWKGSKSGYCIIQNASCQW